MAEKKEKSKEKKLDKDSAQDVQIIPAGSGIGVTSVIRPLVSVQEALKLWDEYLKLKKELLKEEDYQYFVRYKVERNGKVYWKTQGCENRQEAEQLAQRYGGKIEKRIIKSGVKKYDRFFGIKHRVVSKRTEIKDKIIIERVQEDGNITIQVIPRQDDGTITVSYEVMAIAPNGQFTIGNGVCSNTESGKADAPLHNIEATALTRAKNRATMDLVGGGEVTAEEIIEEANGAHSVYSPPPQRTIHTTTQARNGITEPQKKAIRKLQEKLGWDDEAMMNVIFANTGKESIDSLTFREAADLIIYLQRVLNEGA